ncbi:ATP-binding cassette subfamily C protein [Allofrancisella inopinata]|uniref:ABC transporter ATP-binding protein n=1 Tax=Allofrancisella inopinata TaxID=1085647 RepID=A0AAE7CRF0_9GAMM|nr:ABC transporter ATP-binding protein [Allofrancisella inopinata]QIV95583.1 ABC transporter ATP-binding protein [Allofrancisella inopinata]TDT70728.1 ATP-binding cassette subfamily C protein [Allofrancisella inopinata]
MKNNTKNIYYFYLYIKDVIRHSPHRFVIGCILTIINIFCAGIGLLLLIPLFHFFGWSNESQYFVNTSLPTFTKLPKEVSVFIVLAFFLFLITLAAIVEYINTTVTNSFKKSYLYNLKKDFNYKIAHAGWSYLIRNKIKNIEHLFSSGLSQISTLTIFSFQMISALLIAFMYILFALVISPWLTLLTIFLSLLVFAITYKFNPIVNGQKNFAIHTKIHCAFSSFLDGIKLAKSYNAIDNYIDHFDTLNKQSEAVQMEFIRSQKIVSLFVKISSAIVIAIFFYTALIIFKIQLVSMIALLLVFSRLLPNLATIQQNYFRVLNIVPIYIQIKNMMVELEENQEAPQRSIEMQLKEKIQIKDVSFSYAKKKVLNNLNCCLFANQTVAIVGHSGAGKSTFADLLLGVLTVDEGYIKIDDIILDQKYTYSWRRSISYVPQDTYLFNESVKDNLLWAAPEAKDKDIYEALKLAALYDFVTQLPNDINTIIGDRGVYLSGGQKQRLAIARALLRKPKVLLLDEATSALDMQNEEIIYETLKKLKGQITIIIITHRLSTLRATDNILVMDKGTIIEQGNYDELSNHKDSRFNEIFSLSK